LISSNFKERFSFKVKEQTEENSVCSLNTLTSEQTTISFYVYSFLIFFSFCGWPFYAFSSFFHLAW